MELLFRPAVYRVERGGKTMEVVSIPAGRMLAAVQDRSGTAGLNNNSILKFGLRE